MLFISIFRTTPELSGKLYFVDPKQAGLFADLYSRGGGGGGSGRQIWQNFSILRKKLEKNCQEIARNADINFFRALVP